MVLSFVSFGITCHDDDDDDDGRMGRIRFADM
jgi:hypothetical protein